MKDIGVPGQAEDGETRRTGGSVGADRVAIDDLARPGLAGKAPEQSETLSVLEETLSISKRQVKTGSVRISTRTETRDEIAEVMLDHDVVDVTRVPLDRVVDMAPPIRTEGDTTIVPVIEERLVLVKQLVVVEELHIRRRVEHQVTRRSVALRRQHVEVERLDADGRPVT